MFKLILLGSLLGAASPVALAESGVARGCFEEGSWSGNIVFADHVDPIQLNLFRQRQDEYITIGNGRYLARAGIYGEVQIGTKHKLMPIEKAVHTCHDLTFEVHTESGVLLRFRLKVKHIGLGGEAEGEAEFPDQVAHLDLLRWPCGDSVPMLMRLVDPEYTEDARRAKIQGVAELLLRFDSSGRVSNATVLSGLGFGLDENAIEAVKHWEFKFNRTPPAACGVRVNVQFRLP